MIKLGYNNIGKMYLGDIEISKAYLGNDLVYDNSINSSTYDAEVEYLLSDGNLYFVIPIYFNDSTDAIEVDFRRTANVKQQRFCCSLGTSYTGQIYVNGSDNVGYYKANDWNTASRTALGLVRHLLKVDFYNNQVIYDCMKVAISGRIKTIADGEFAIFKAVGTYPGIKAQIYSFKYWRKGILIFDLVPVRKDGVGYLYDKIGRKLYGNEGTGLFTIGYDKYKNYSDYTPCDYIENTTKTATSPYIDSRVSNEISPIQMQMTVKWNNIDSGARQLMGGNMNPWFGCDKGVWKGTSDLNDTVPSTTEFTTANSSVWSAAPTGTSVYPLLLFKLYESNSRAMTSTTYICNCKLSGFKIWVDSVLVRDFKPVKHPSGRYGLFDIIENKWYDSANSGSFTGLVTT